MTLTDPMITRLSLPKRTRDFWDQYWNIGPVSEPSSFLIKKKWLSRFKCPPRYRRSKSPSPLIWARLPKTTLPCQHKWCRRVLARCPAGNPRSIDTGKCSSTILSKFWIEASQYRQLIKKERHYPTTTEWFKCGHSTPCWRLSKFWNSCNPNNRNSWCKFSKLRSRKKECGRRRCMKCNRR